MSGEKLGGSSAGGDLYSGTLARCHAMLPYLLRLFGIQSASLSAHVHRRASAVGSRCPPHSDLPLLYCDGNDDAGDRLLLIAAACRAQGGDGGAGAGVQDGRLVQEGTRLTNSSTRESAQERLGMELEPPGIGIWPTPGVPVVGDVPDMLLHSTSPTSCCSLPTTRCRGFWCVLGAYLNQGFLPRHRSDCLNGFPKEAPSALRCPVRGRTLGTQQGNDVREKDTALPFCRSRRRTTQSLAVPASPS